MYIDAHNHLHDPRLAATLPAVIDACERLGISLSVVNGTRQDDWAQVNSLAAQHSWIIPSYGLHPWFIHERTATWASELEALLDKAPAAIGEVGIDYWKDGINRVEQHEVFLQQLAIACERNLPITIHGLKAWQDLFSLLREHGVPRVGFLLHSYSGPVDLVDRFVELGAYFSCPPAFFDPSRSKKLEVFRLIPLERLLAETDAPDQAPPRGVRRFSVVGDELSNHPGNIVIVYEGLAKVRGITLGELSIALDENARRLFARATRVPLRA